MTCPQCSADIPSSKTVGKSAICTCGWFGSTDHEKNKLKAGRRRLIARVAVAFGIIVCGLTIFEYKRWGSYVGNHTLIQLKGMVGLASVEDWQALGIMCATMKRFSCSERAFTHVLKEKPRNEFALLQLGFAQTKLHKYESAVSHFERLFKDAPAGYISSAAYAKAMAGLGRTDEAKSWFYKSIRMEPRALDTVDGLLDLLVKKEAYAEALSLIGTINALVPTAKKHFTAKTKALYEQMGIQSASEAKPRALQVANIRNYSFLPIRIDNMSTPALFMIDPRKDGLTLSPDFLESHGLPPSGKISQITIGPWTLKNITTKICDGCPATVGKSVLKQFQISNETTQGVEYLSLTR